MLSRRMFLDRALKGSSLVALAPAIPGFLASTARAAGPGKDNILVVLEMTGGNDGLNTVIPYADDLYHAARPTIRLGKGQVIRVDDHVGLNPSLRGLSKLLDDGQLAILQGVGYPNPDRSHFEAMDIWQAADPNRKVGNGWLGRGLGALQVETGKIPGIHVGTTGLPLALRGSATGVPTIHASRPFDLELATREGQPNQRMGRRFVEEMPGPAPSSDDEAHAPRRRLIEDLSKIPPAGDGMPLFARRTSLQTLAAIDHLREVSGAGRRGNPRGGGRFDSDPFGNQRQPGGLAENLSLVGNLIASEFGTRVFYLSVDGFDTHAGQLQAHGQVLQQVGDAIAGFYAQLDRSGHASRVVLMTFSEFGRRVRENGSQGTDHGAASCLFVAGPAVRGGVIGEHPSLALDRLDDGDLRHHTDFRRVYATLLDRWLGCPSREVLSGDFEHVPLLKTI